MKVGDLVTFCPESWGTPIEDRPVGIVVATQPYDDFAYNEMVTVKFAGDDIPYSSKAKDFEVVNENW